MVEEVWPLIFEVEARINKTRKFNSSKLPKIRQDSSFTKHKEPGIFSYLVLIL